MTAQFLQTCVEPARVQPTYMCNQTLYDPVCGCDHKTYRNQCNAYNNHGINLWTSGVCSGIDVDFYPNPVVQGTMLTVNIAYPDFYMGNATLYITDMYGKTWEQRFLNNFNRTQIQFDMTAIPTGVYVLVVISSNKVGVSKLFSKY